MISSSRPFHSKLGNDVVLCVALIVAAVIVSGVYFASGRTKHGIAFLGLAVVGAIGAWFTTAPDKETGGRPADRSLSCQWAEPTLLAAPRDRDEEEDGHAEEYEHDCECRDLDRVLLDSAPNPLIGPVERQPCAEPNRGGHSDSSSEADGQGRPIHRPTILHTSRQDQGLGLANNR
jgi:hypothetical protein